MKNLAKMSWGFIPVSVGWIPPSQLFISRLMCSWLAGWPAKLCSWTLVRWQDVLKDHFRHLLAKRLSEFLHANHIVKRPRVCSWTLVWWQNVLKDHFRHLLAKRLSEFLHANDIYKMAKMLLLNSCVMTRCLEGSFQTSLGKEVVGIPKC